MQPYALPTELEAVILDIDRTLYDNDEYADSQVESQYRRAAAHWGITISEVKDRVRGWRAEYAAAHNDAHQSLGNTLAGLGIPIETSVIWRNQEIDPAQFLTSDKKLRAALLRLSESVHLAAVTNNPVDVGRRTLETLGVSDLVPIIVGLDSTNTSKPNTRPFERGLSELAAPPSRTISVGDRFDVDINPALALGMGAVLVDGVADVHELPDFLAQHHLIEVATGDA